uniref:Uncharacterized protein n=1 Tax=Quercus lobata TaxID=97700 RepID=A0A7N2LQE1_QUELO
MGTMSGDQRQITPALPLHLVDVITVGDGVQSFADASGFCKNLFQACIQRIPLCHQITSVDRALCCRLLHQLIGRSAASPSATTATSFDNTSPLQYANSPRSGTNMMNKPSPQQHTPQQLQHQKQQQRQRQKLMQLPQHQQQQLLAQQQFRQSAIVPSKVEDAYGSLDI